MRLLNTILWMALIASFQLLSGQVDIKPDSSVFHNKVSVYNTFENNGMKFPSVDGTDGQALTTDGQGNLHWSDMAGQSDLLDYFDYFCESPDTFLMNDWPNHSNAICGWLYDSGGPTGDYGNGEYEYFRIDPANDAMYTRLILLFLDVEDNRDTLFINGMPYFTDITEPDTLVFQNINEIIIEFKSDEVVNGQGFCIFWDRLLFQGQSSFAQSMPGFFFNAEKQSVGGGIEFDSAWAKVGHRAVLLGFGGEAGEQACAIGYRNAAMGDYSNAVGVYNEAMGDNSSAFGYRNDATGSYSSAFGSVNEATGKRSSAFGRLNDATGSYSSAFGRLNDATGLFSSAFGFGNDAMGENSSAFGSVNEATGFYSSAFGSVNEATGERSSAFGYGNDAMGDYSSAFGAGCYVDVYQMMAVGGYNENPSGSADTWVPEDPAFMIGNGQNVSNRSTALTILKNGKVGIGTLTPETLLHIEGDLQLKELSIGDRGSDNLGLQGDVIPFITPTTFDIGNGTNDENWDRVFCNALVEVSDCSVKRDVVDLGYGLKELLQLRPVKYHLVRDLPEQKPQLGLIAQEVEPIMPELVASQDADPDENGQLRLQTADVLGMHYNRLTVVLVNAVKEQQAQIEEQQETIQQLEEKLVRMEALEARMAEMEQQFMQFQANCCPQAHTTSHTLQGQNDDDQPRLHQNQPNPFNGSTIIPYYLPASIPEAQLRITNLQGQLIDLIELPGPGLHRLELQTGALPPGSYQYTLLIDGLPWDTKQMVIQQ
jgi:hypothetical protein